MKKLERTAKNGMTNPKKDRKERKEPIIRKRKTKKTGKRERSF